MGQLRGARLSATSFSKLFKLRKWFPRMLVVAAGLVGPVDFVFSQPTTDTKPMPKPDMPGVVVPHSPATPSVPAAPPEKTFEVHFDKAPWDDVLERYSKESGLTLITTVKPTGSLTLKPQKDPSNPTKNRMYTIAEFTDLLNDALMQQKFILIRRHQTFFIHPADEKVPMNSVPRIELSELPKRGRSEIVSVVIPIEGMVVADVQEELKKLLTPLLGTLVPLEKPNFLLVQDTAGSIRQIMEVLDILKGDKGRSDSHHHVCVWRHAQVVAEKLKELITDKETTVTMTGTQAIQPFGDPRFGFGQDFGRGRDFGRDFGRDSRGQQQPTSNARVKTVQIAVDAPRNAVIVTAPQDKIVLAKQLIEDIDKQVLPSDRKIEPQAAVVKMYSVPTGTADNLAKSLQTKYPWMTIAPLVAQNQIMVLATPHDQNAIKELLDGPDSAPAVAETQFVPLTVLDPTEAATTATKMMPGTAQGGPTIEAVKSGNYGLLVKGTPAQVAEVKNILYGIGEPKPRGNDANPPGANQLPSMRTFSLGADVNAQLLAEMLGRAMEGTGKKVIIQNALGGSTRPSAIPPSPDGSGNIPQSPSTEPRPTPPPPMPAPMKPPGGSSLREPLPGRDNLYPVNAQIVDPEKKKDDKPIVIQIVGNKLVISSEDTVALENIAQLYRLLTTEATKPNDMLLRVIPLKVISAEDAAREITEIFNGPQQQQQGGQNRGGFNPLGALFGGFGRNQQQSPAGEPAAGRVRVVAEKSSNSLIVVKASLHDYKLIEQLLASVIDGGPNQSTVVMKTYRIPLANADAAEMSSLVTSVFRSYMATSGGNQQVSGFPFMAGMGQQQQQQRPPALSIAVDDRSNSLVLMCTEGLYQDIKKMVAELDEATVSTTEVTQLVKLKGVDPDVVQQAINALQGRDTRNQGTGGQGRGGQGGNRGGGGNLGGQGLPSLGTGFGSQGFPGMGGGGNRGGGGGNRGGGGGNFGGGGQRGGGGGGQRGGGRIGLGPTEGPLNFDYRGKDAPSAAFKLYDPQTDVPDYGYNRPAEPKANNSTNPIVQAGAQVPAGQPRRPMPGDDVYGDMNPPRRPDGRPQQSQPVFNSPAPRGTVSAIPVEGLDVVIVRAGDLADLKIVLELIDMVAEYSKGSAPRVEVVYLQYGDCNTIATQLNSIFARVTIGQDGNYVPAQARTPQNNIQTQVAGVSPTQNVYALALPRFNGILLAAPENKFDEVVRKMRELLDNPNRAPLKAFRLKKASAQIIGAQLQNFWNTRFPGDSLQQNQFRITFDIANNTLFVQGSPADLLDVEEMLKYMDEPGNLAVNQMRIFFLRNALADEMGQVISSAISSNVVSPTAQSQQTGPIATQAGGASIFNAGLPILPGFNQGLNQGLGQFQGLGQLGLNQAGLGLNQGLNQSLFRPINAIIPTIGTGAGGGLVTKTKAIRFYSRDGQMFETGYLEDVNIVSSARVNALIVSAPEATMRLIEKLLENLDTVAAARAYVNVFQLRKGMDAALTANLLRQLFSITGQAQTTNQPLQGGLNQPQQSRPLPTLFGNVADGASLIDVRITVDDRTNSLIVSGSRNDLEVVTAILSKLETADPSAGRYQEVIKLRNAAAADVATTIQTFFQNQLQTVFTPAGFSGAYQQLLRNVVVIADPGSNTLLIDATPEYFGRIKAIIDRIDSQPPQVLIQVTIAEVQLTNTREFGVEVGLQSPVLFDRAGSTAAGAGFNFNTPTPSTTLPSNLVGPGTVGFTGLGNLNVGRVSATQGFSGFLFSASNDTFSLLIRALTAQGRVTVLSRPQIQVADSQIGYINVGQSFPLVGGTTITNGLSQQNITYVNIGITLQVTPRVNPDGKVLMRVDPSVSSVQPGQVTVGNGLLASVLNQQVVSTTVLASDGETIILGGLISEQEQRNENGIPYFKDIPYVGALFRYRTQSIQRREILIIMTPHIIRSEFDNARVLAEEAGPTQHNWEGVLRAHKHGSEVIGPATQGARPVPVNPSSVPPQTGTPFYGDPIPIGVAPHQPAPAPMPSTPVQPAPLPSTPMQPSALPPSTLPPTTLLPQIPGASMSTPGTLIPTSGNQPTFTPPPAPAPMPMTPTLTPAPASMPVTMTPTPTPMAVVPTPAPASVSVAPSAPQPLFTIQSGAKPATAAPTAPTPQAVVPAAPVLGAGSNQPFVMQPPAQGTNAPPAKSNTTKAKEGDGWKDFAR